MNEINTTTREFAAGVIEQALERIGSAYGLPFLKCGLTVRYGDREGRIVGFRGQYLRIRFDGMKGDHIGSYHPTWNLVYLDSDGNELANFQEARYERD